MMIYDDNSEDTRLNREVRYANKTGLCPICKTRKSARAITCGDWACLNHWLPGGDKTLPINKGALIIS